MKKYSIKEADYNTETLEIRLFTGILHLQKPTANLFFKIVKYQNTDANDVKKVEKAVDKIIFSILNTNLENKRITEKQVRKMDFMFKLNILKSYIDFINTITERKN